MAPPTPIRWVTPAGQTVLLDGSAGIKVQRGVNGLDAADVELFEEARLNHDGSVPLRIRRPPRSFDMPILVDTNVVSVGAVVRLFKPIKVPSVEPNANPMLRGGTLVASSVGGDRSLTNVLYEVGAQGVWSADAGGIGSFTHRKFPLRLRAMDPWWYGPVESEVLNIEARTASNDAAVASNGHTPSSGGGSTLLAVPGDEDAYPRFVIDGPFTTLRLLGSETGDYVELAAPLAAGDQLVIDSTPGSVGPRLNGGPVDRSLLTPDSREFELPAPAASVAFTGTGTDANSMVQVQWRNRYETP